jgi:hypothetical protein
MHTLCFDKFSSFSTRSARLTVITEFVSVVTVYLCTEYKKNEYEREAEIVLKALLAAGCQLAPRMALGNLLTQSVSSAGTRLALRLHNIEMFESAKQAYIFAAVPVQE